MDFHKSVGTCVQHRWSTPYLVPVVLHTTVTHTCTSIPSTCLHQMAGRSITLHATNTFKLDSTNCGRRLGRWVLCVTYDSEICPVFLYPSCTSFMDINGCSAVEDCFVGDGGGVGGRNADWKGEGGGLQ